MEPIPRERQARLPLDIAVDVAASLDPDEVVRRLLRRAIEAIHADRGSVSWIEGNELIVVDSQDPEATPLPVGSRWPIALQSHTHRAVTTRRPVVSGTVDLGTLTGPMRDALAGVRHTVSLPLEASGEVVAILAVSRRRDQPYDDDDVATLRAIGTVAVLALRNARLYAQAQEAARAKAAFLNIAAHELRTPLTVVSGYISMLREGSLGVPDERWRRPLDVIASKCTELGDLVDNLLLTARLEHGQTSGTRVAVDVGDAVAAAVGRALPRVELLGGRVEYTRPEPATRALAQPLHVARILDNLVNNALSYSRETPWVSLAVRPGERPEIVVEDRGEGIPEAMRERVFERFVRVDQGATQERTGTGLGLAISRELAEWGGGELLLEWSELGWGSRFVLRLPAAPGDVAPSRR
jgi:signal transduction histidine kinase